MIPALRRRLERVPRGRLDPTDDTGAVMVLALILVTVVAVVVGALLSFGDTSIRVTVAVRSQAATSYAGDGAAQAAITALRRSPFNNDPSSATYPKCFGSGASADTLVLPNFYPGTTGGAATSAAVKCTPDPNTGAGGSLVPITKDNKPGNAILTLGQNPAEDGLNVKPLNNSIPFLVHGGVISQSNIKVSNGILQSNTYVRAHTGCSGTIISVPAASCSSGLPILKPYNTEAAAAPAYRTAPAATTANCPVVSGGGRLVTFQPGYYDDAQALNSLMNGVGSNPCKGSVWWFTPGTYYFDFHNTSNPLLSGSDVWTIKDGQLIGGTPVNAAGTVISKPTVPATVPGACQNPIEDSAAVGVQFIFGGDSQVQLSGTADAEVCASYHADRPPIAVYGLDAGAESQLSGTYPPSAVVNPPAPALFTTASVTAANLATGDGVGASWVKSTTTSETGSFTVQGFAPAAGIPAGSVLNSATLRVVYNNTQGQTGDTRTVVLTPTAGGAAISTTLPLTSGSASQTAQVNLFSGGTGPLATAIHNFGFTGATMALTAKLAHKGTETIDALQLDLGYTVPAFRSEKITTIPGGNCLQGTYTGTTGGGCAALTTSVGPNYKGRFYVQGTTYMPEAAIDLTLNNITEQVLRFGVISRSLWVKETGSITYSGPVIEIPDDSPGFGPGGTVVYLDVYLCEAAATCSTTTGRLSLRVRVLIYDPSGSPVPSSRQMTIQSWSVQR